MNEERFNKVARLSLAVSSLNSAISNVERTGISTTNLLLTRSEVMEAYYDAVQECTIEEKFQLTQTGYYPLRGELKN